MKRIGLTRGISGSLEGGGEESIIYDKKHKQGKINNSGDQHNKQATTWK